MNFVKRLLGILLTASIIVGQWSVCGTVVFASEASTEMTLNTPTEVVIDDSLPLGPSYVHYITFTPESDGLYTLRSLDENSESSYDIVYIVYVNGEPSIKGSESYDAQLGAEFTCRLKANQTYTFALRKSTSVAENITANVEIVQAQTQELTFNDRSFTLNKASYGQKYANMIFTPDFSGSYRFTFNSDDTAKRLLIFDKDVVDLSYGSSFLGRITPVGSNYVDVLLEKGAEYFVLAYSANNNAASDTYSVKVEYTPAESEISLDTDTVVTVTDNEESAYNMCNMTRLAFIPEESGLYSLRSKYDGAYVPYGCLFSGDNKTCLAENFKCGHLGNFDVIYYLEAGRTYYYGVGFNSDTQTGDVKVCLSRYDNSVVDVAAAADGGYTVSASGTTDYKLFNYYKFTPTLGGKYTISVSNGAYRYIKIFDDTADLSALSKNYKASACNEDITYSFNAGQDYYISVVSFASITKFDENGMIGAGSSIGSGTSSYTVSFTKEPTHEISFNANGGSGEPEPVYGCVGDTVVIPSQIPQKAENRFLGWGTTSAADENSTLYQPGDDYVVTDTDVILYAVWKYANFEGLWTDDGNVATGFDGGNGTEASPYKIANASQLALLSKNVSNYSGCYFEQTADIDLDKIYWVPVGTNTTSAFTGYYDGKNYKISNMAVTSDYKYGGLFGYVKSGSVSNVVLNSGEIKGEYSVTSYIGGIAGYASAATISKCTVNSGFYIDVTSTGTVYCGGIVGGATGTSSITACKNASSVDAEGTANMGGIGGYCNNINVVFDKCANTGDVGTKSNSAGTNGYVGGIVGYMNSGKIYNSYNTGKVNRSGTASNLYVGGISGRNQNASGVIENCYNTGSVTCDGTNTCYVGGIVGNNNGEVKNVYSTCKPANGGSCVGTAVSADSLYNLYSSESGDVIYSSSSEVSTSGTKDYAEAAVILNTYVADNSDRLLKWKSSEIGFDGAYTEEEKFFTSADIAKVLKSVAQSEIIDMDNELFAEYNIYKKNENELNVLDAIEMFKHLSE